MPEITSWKFFSQSPSLAIVIAELLSAVLGNCVNRDCKNENEISETSYLDLSFLMLSHHRYFFLVAFGWMLAVVDWG